MSPGTVSILVALVPFAALALLAATGGDTDDSDRDKDPVPEKPPAGAEEEKLQRHQQGFIAAVKKYGGDLEQLAKQELSKETTDKKARAERAAAVSSAGAMLANIPYVGQILAIAAQVAAALLGAFNYGGEVNFVQASDFSGWKENTYWFRDTPVYGPAIGKFLPALEKRQTRGSPEALTALRALIKAYPNGPDVERVSIGSTGDFEYLFNPFEPGNLSEEQRQAERVKGLQVFSPKDIRPTGPRGFDPENPRSWKVPGERKSRFDVGEDPAAYL